MKQQIGAVIEWALLVTAFGLYIYGIYFVIFTPLNTINQAKQIISVHVPKPFYTFHNGGDTS